jgi:alkylation response protein AidB-like acyl-CoA dehydrogenase
MHFGLSWEQQQLKEAARGFLGQLRTAREVLDGASVTDPAMWARVVEEQGWPAIAIPEACGGFGFGWMELAVVFEELGRTLTPCPLLGTCMAVAALLEAPAGAARDEALQAIATGRTAALVEGLESRDAPEGTRLLGTAPQVVHGADAELLVAVTSAGLALVEAGDVEVEPLPTLDVTRSLAAVEANLPVPPEAWLGPVDLGAVHGRCEALIAAESTGSAEAALEMAVAYAKVREQFGKPIGSFQAIQHLCADMLVAVESARSATWYAAWAIDDGADDAREACRIAKAAASEAALHCAGQNIQIHGGIGFTWEHDAHLYFKRARSGYGLLGEPAEHRAAVADALLGPL